jgi:DNA modification methylase
VIKAEYCTIVRDGIPLNVERNTILNIVTDSVTEYTHGFHKYPAKFIPQIPRWAIEKYLRGRGKYILDPFCGSGTTLVEGMLAGHNVIGIDIDPLSTMIAKVKTTRVEVAQLETICNWVLKQVQGQRWRGTFRPECPSIEHWFTQDAITKLSVIRTIIDQVPEEFGHTKQTSDIVDLLMICFSSIIRRVSNADNESQKTYVSHTKVKIPQETVCTFLDQLDYFKNRATQFSLRVDRRLTNQVICSTSTEHLNGKLAGRIIEIAVTSPPYIKAIDYIYNQMVELFWLGDLFGLQTQDKQNIRKQDYIGTKQIHKKAFVYYTPFKEKLGIGKLDDKLRKVYTNDEKNGHKHSYVTHRYFSEMEKHFVEMGRCLSPKTHHIMVVGDCSVSGIPFETSEFLINMAERNGFRMVNKFGYKIKNRYMRFDRKGRGGIIAIDWVLDFVKR